MCSWCDHSGRNDCPWLQVQWQRNYRRRNLRHAWIWNYEGTQVTGKNCGYIVYSKCTHAEITNVVSIGRLRTVGLNKIIPKFRRRNLRAVWRNSFGRNCQNSRANWSHSHHPGTLLQNRSRDRSSQVLPGLDDQTGRGVALDRWNMFAIVHCIWYNQNRKWTLPEIRSLDKWIDEKGMPLYSHFLRNIVLVISTEVCILICKQIIFK